MCNTFGVCFCQSMQCAAVFGLCQTAGAELADGRQSSSHREGTRNSMLLQLSTLSLSCCYHYAAT